MRAFLGAGALVSLLLVAGVGTSSAATCQELLGDNLYRCTFKLQGEKQNLCLQVDSSSPSASDRFDLFVVNSSGGPQDNLFGCTCNAAGSVENPDFGASKDFLCAGLVLGPGVPLSAAIEGTVKNEKKITNGQLWLNPTLPGLPSSTSGLGATFGCKVDPDCGSVTVTAESSGSNEGVE